WPVGRHDVLVWMMNTNLLSCLACTTNPVFLKMNICYGPTMGGLLNATCGNAIELIIIEVVKCSLHGFVLSNLLLVLGTPLFCGGIVNLGDEQLYDRSLPLMLRYAAGASEHFVVATTVGLDLSRAYSIVMLLAYVAYLFFQLRTHAQLFKPQEVDEDGGEAEEDKKVVIGFASALFWLAFKTVLIVILSEYVVGTIETTSSPRFLSVLLETSLSNNLVK
ncbi:hypothetical protein ACJX0J_033780, partial [Zea mays]